MAPKRNQRNECEKPMKETKSPLTQTETVAFYGGSFGGAFPMILLFITLAVLSVLGYSSGKSFWAAAFLSLMVGFLLIKDKRQYQQILIDGLSDQSLAMVLLTFFVSGVMSVLLTIGGLCDGLVYLAVATHVPAAILPLCIFFLCVLVSSSTGTTSGTVAAATPVLLPLAVTLGCDPALVMGAIISGGYFGDNLAPVSDTTIASAATQECEIIDVVRSRFKYSVIAGAISAVLFLWQGFRTTQPITNAEALEPSSLLGLVLLVCPVLLVIMMLKGKNFIYALMFNTILAALLCLVTGKLSFSLFFDAEGVVAQGLGNCMNAAVLCMLIFMVIQILKVSGVFAKISAVVVAKCRTYKQAEGIVGFLAMLGAAMMGGGTYSILLSGGLARNLLKNFQVARTRGANILDGLACGTAGLLPYGGAVLYAVSCAAATGMVGSEFTAFSFIPYNYHCMLLIAVYWISIIIGFGKKFEKDEAI